MKNTPQRILRSGALADLPEGFHRLNGTRKVDAILSLEDPESFIQELAPDAFYLLIQDIGSTDCTELLALSSFEQRQAYSDIECWQAGEFVPTALEEYLDLLGNCSAELLDDTVAGLDPEILVSYLLQNIVLVADRTEEHRIELVDQLHDSVESPDGDFWLFLPHGSPEVKKRVRWFLHLLYRIDLNYARSVLFSAKVGLRSENEELALRFRTGRLGDLGFPEPEDAQALYAGIDLDALRQDLAEQVPPAVDIDRERLNWALVRTHRTDSFLSRCLAELRQPDRFTREFAFCVNRAIVASPEGLHLRDLSRIEGLGRVVYATVSLGLEFLADGDETRGTAILERAWCLQLFQAGQSLAVSLANRARKVQERAGGLLDGDLQALIAGLCRLPQPLYTEGSTVPRPFETLDEINQVSARLQTVETTCRVFEDAFGFSRERFERHEFAGIGEDDRLFIHLDTLARTLVAHEAAGDTPSFEPLTLVQLEKVQARTNELAAVGLNLGQRIGAGAEEILGRAGESLTEILAPLRSDGPLDARFFTGVLLVQQTGAFEEKAG